MKPILSLSILLLYSLGAHAADPKKITVTGQCTAEVAADRGSVNFVVEKLEPDSKAAVQKASLLHEQLRDELKKLNVKGLELSSSEYTVSEKKEWEKNKSVSKGFSARIGLRALTPDIAALGELMATAGRLGIKETSGLTTFVSEAKWREENKQCLDRAAKNAEEKARVLVTTLHAKLGQVIQVNERSAFGSAPQPNPYERALLPTSRAETAPTIEGQKQNLSQEVEVTFLIE